jgi:hypothetical protein
MTYGHAERNRIAAQLAVAETIELLLRLPRLDKEQIQFVQEFAPGKLRLGGPRTTCPCGSGLPDPAKRAIRSDVQHNVRMSRRDHQ